MLSTTDLQRVSAEKAAAVLVLCDKFSQEPGKEDLSNIMRVISLKNYSESTRCIIQLLYYSSKVFITSILNYIMSWTLFTLVQHFRCTSTPIIHKHK